MTEYLTKLEKELLNALEKSHQQSTKKEQAISELVNGFRRLLNEQEALQQSFKKLGVSWSQEFEEHLTRLEARLNALEQKLA